MRGAKMRLNLGCGRKVLDGWYNIDISRSDLATRDPELFCDLKKLKLADNVADEAMAIHVIEHFYEWEVIPLLKEWLRVLKPGAMLVIECPDVMKSAKNLVDGTAFQESMWGLYGDPRHCDEYMVHRWGWTPETLTEYLKEAGFRKIKSCDPQWHGKRVHRDLRLEAIK